MTTTRYAALAAAIDTDIAVARVIAAEVVDGFALANDSGAGRLHLVRGQRDDLFVRPSPSGFTVEYFGSEDTYFAGILVARAIAALNAPR
ncbi:MAG: hypothetical protein M0006_02210 [Magnetospirillum sp.]|nr:hypothetical protein [Magnetospirillum sp.]